MPIKIKSNFSIQEDLASIQKRYISQAPSIIKEAIINSMSKGTSPVEGGEWKKPYSKSYLKTIKRYYQGLKNPTPVNLKLSGQLYEDLEVTPKQNSMLVHFKGDSDRIAKYHNEEGAGKSKAIRRILPTIEGETFNKAIRLKMDSLLRSIVQSFIK